MRAVCQNKYVQYDVETITAGDYTVEFYIEKEMYQNFKSYFYDPNNPIPEVCQFRIYIEDELK